MLPLQQHHLPQRFTSHDAHTALPLQLLPRHWIHDDEMRSSGKVTDPYTHDYNADTLHFMSSDAFLMLDEKPSPVEFQTVILLESDTANGFRSIGS